MYPVVVVRWPKWDWCSARRFGGEGGLFIVDTRATIHGPVILGSPFRTALPLGSPSCTALQHTGKPLLHSPTCTKVVGLGARHTRSVHVRADDDLMQVGLGEEGFEEGLGVAGGARRDAGGLKAVAPEHSLEAA